MGKKSTKENKNMYFQCREAAGLTRAQASELLGFISESRIEKIESEKTPATSDTGVSTPAESKDEQKTQITNKNWTVSA